MATYAIGDIQGCFKSFQALLKKIQFDSAADRLWLAGDLVNRGPDSLSVLRWIHAHRASVVAVLGNHDFGLLRAFHLKLGARPGKDTFGDVLAADDCEELLAWMRTLPIVHGEGEFLLCHAGLLPQWSAEDALALSRACQKYLQGPEVDDFLAALFVKPAEQWRNGLLGMKQAVIATNVIARIRVCNSAGEVDFSFSENVHEIFTNFHQY